MVADYGLRTIGIKEPPFSLNYQLAVTSDKWQVAREKTAASDKTVAIGK
jgi:hypothetical protein